MEVGMRKHRQTMSPERIKTWTQPHPKPGRKVAVVYYLCRSRHLEQPHFIEIPLSSSTQGLHLRDFVDRLNVVRGKGMPGMYSWSCKRSYKNGFVWHDLCEDDLVHPTNGSEYVLKGSELLDEPPPPPPPPPDRYQHSNNGKLQTPKQLHEASSSSSIGKWKPQEEDPSSTPSRLSSSSGMSPDSINIAADRSVGRNQSWGSSLNLSEHRVYKDDSIVVADHGASDASTQTNERARRTGQTCIRGVSTDDIQSETEPTKQSNQNHSHSHSKEIELSRVEISPPPSSSSASSGEKLETLESLIRADAKANSFRILEEEQVRAGNSKIKPSNVLLQLISCGSFSVKDHSFGLVPTYKPRFSHVSQNAITTTTFTRSPSPLFCNSIMLGELDYLSENLGMMALRLEDKECFSGSLIETKKHQDDGQGAPALKRSSYDADRTCKSSDPAENSEKEEDSVRSKCIPRTIKCSKKKPSMKETLRSPVVEQPRNSSARIDCLQSMSPSIISNENNMQIIVDAADKRLSSRIEDNGNIIKIEERLPSGAWVIIRSKAAYNDTEGSNSS